MNINQAQSKMCLHYNAAAKNFNEALPLGNGSTGMMVYGRPDKEIISLNEDTLWSGVPNYYADSYASASLPIARRAIDEGRYFEAQEMIRRKMQGRYSQAYMPMGDLLLDFPHNAEKVSDYERRLDILRGVFTQRYTYEGTVYRREIFVSYPRQVMVIRLSSDGRGKINFSAGLISKLMHRVSERDDGSLLLYGCAPTYAEPSYAFNVALPMGEEKCIDEAKSIKFGVLMRAVNYGGECLCADGRLTVKNADSAVLILASGTSFNGYDKLPDKDFLPVLERNIKEACKKEYAELLSEHIKDFSALSERVSLNLDSGDDGITTDERLRSFKEKRDDPKMVELLFQYGRYLMISASRPGTKPTNLQGIWNDSLTPPWSSNYTININLQMNYWQANTANLSECAQPLFDFLRDLHKSGRRTAESHYNCRGFSVAHNTDIWAHSVPVEGDPNYAYWPMGGAWLALSIYEQYLFTRDEEFLKEYYPVLRDAALFCHDWLYYDEKVQSFVTCPSTSPENRFLVTENGEKRLCAASKASTSDMAIIRELFYDTLAAAELVGESDEKFICGIKERLEKLYPYHIGEDGRLMEWSVPFKENEPGHRHMSHLIGLYPGTHITREKTPELVQAAAKSIDFRVKNGGGHTGWSAAWLISLYARLGDGEGAEGFVEKLIANSTQDNLLNVCPPFQIDGNFGFTAGVCEMLLQSHEDYIELLPALPGAWKNGNVRGLKTRGAFVIDMEWEDGVLLKVKIESLKGGACRLKYHNRLLSIDTEQGKQYELSMSEK